MRDVIRGLVYFALVFSAGFVLGPLRVFVLVPRVGTRMAELIEMPIMLAVIVFAARWVTRRFPATRRVSYLGSGLGALVLLVVVEVTVVLRLMGLTFSEYLTSRDPVAGVVYLLMLIAFGLMPWIAGGNADGTETMRFD